MTARPRDRICAGPRRIASSTGSAAAPPVAASGVIAPVTNGTAVNGDNCVPAGSAPAGPPPAWYRTARTFRNPSGTRAPLIPSPKVTTPAAWSTVKTRWSWSTPARLGTSDQRAGPCVSSRPQASAATSSTSITKLPGRTGNWVSCIRVRWSRPCDSRCSTSPKMVRAAIAVTAFSRIAAICGGCR